MPEVATVHIKANDRPQGRWSHSPSSWPSAAHHQQLSMWLCLGTPVIP